MPNARGTSTTQLSDNVINRLTLDEVPEGTVIQLLGVTELSLNIIWRAKVVVINLLLLASLQRLNIGENSYSLYEVSWIISKPTNVVYLFLNGYIYIYIWWTCYSVTNCAWRDAIPNYLSNKGPLRKHKHFSFWNSAVTSSEALRGLRCVAS